MDDMQNRAAAPATEGREEGAANAKPSFWQRCPVILIGTVALEVVLFLGLGSLAETLTH